ncbi:MAG: glutathione S-transferase family protein [Pseudomonadota bacterium]
MRTLFTQSFDPNSRFIKLVLAEKQLDARFETPTNDEDGAAFAIANPALTVPVLIDEAPTGGEVSISPETAIAEYLDEAYPGATLMPQTSAGRAEVRRLLAWAAVKFEADVNTLLLRPRLESGGRYIFEPDARRAGLSALQWHLDYFNWLLEQRAWLAGEKMTLADFSIAARLSTLDYFGDISWTSAHNDAGGLMDVKAWYARMKCRPSFRQVLEERFANTPPASHYQNPDF